MMKYRNGGGAFVAEHVTCEHGEHRARSLAVDTAVLERASGIFRALGDPARLRLLEYLTHGECCVSAFDHILSGS